MSWSRKTTACFKRVNRRQARHQGKRELARIIPDSIKESIDLDLEPFVYEDNLIFGDIQKFSEFVSRELEFTAIIEKGIDPATGGLFKRSYQLKQTLERYLKEFGPLNADQQEHLDVTVARVAESDSYFSGRYYPDYGEIDGYYDEFDSYYLRELDRQLGY
jgi:hypothetical protein